MTNEELFNSIKQMIVDQLGVDEDTITEKKIMKCGRNQRPKQGRRNRKTTPIIIAHTFLFRIFLCSLICSIQN